MTEPPAGFSRIALRLRLVLLAIALLALIQPVLMYISTNSVLDEQTEVSEQLLSTSFRVTNINQQIESLAGQGGVLKSATTFEELDASQRRLDESIDQLIEALSEQSGVSAMAGDFTRIKDDLKSYEDLVSDEYNAKRKEIEAQERLSDIRVEIRSTSSNISALLSSAIARQKITLDQNLRQIEGGGTGQDIQNARNNFNTLITLNSLADSSVFSLVEQGRTTNLAQRQRAQLQIQIRTLATQIAKLAPGDTQTQVGMLTLRLNKILFEAGGAFEQIDILRSTGDEIDRIDLQQNELANDIRRSSQQLVEFAQYDLIETAAEAGTLLSRARWTQLVVALAVTTLAIIAILFIVERQFTQRIRILTRRVTAIAKGQPDTDPPLGGSDELTRMSDALEVFKRNSAELRSVNRLLGERSEDIKRLSMRLETVLDTTSSGIVAFDQDGQILLANLPARHILGGVTLEAPFERPKDVRFLDRESLSPLDASADPLNRAIAGQKLNNEIALMERDGAGDGRYVRISSNRVEDPTSSVVSVIAIDDVSEAEQNRQQIERASRLDALGQLTGGIAHDFNNLLATIQYAVDLANEAKTPEERTRFTKIALESVERGGKLSGRLLSFAKRQPGVSKSYQIEKIIAEFQTLVEPTIEQLIDLRFVIEEPDLAVFCDGAQLENALLNLVLNARDAILRSGTGNTITVAVRGIAELSPITKGDRADPDRYATDALEMEILSQESQDRDAVFRYVEFSVTDNGPGMTEEVKRRALDPFFTTKATNSGTGLGLSMVYGFVQQSGGELRIYSEPNQGTTMRIMLPRGAETDDREGPTLPAPPTTGEGQRILLVEDEDHLREAMHAMIENLGYEVVIASSGRVALDLLESEKPFDLLLTDVVMPGGIGGFDLAGKARELRPELPVLYMSGYAAYTQGEMGAVVAPLLQKPCGPAQLADALHAVLNTPLHS